MKYFLYNPLSNNSRGRDKVEELKQTISATEIDVTTKTQEQMRDFCQGLGQDDLIYLVGGDGTLQRFANAVYGLELCPVYFCPAGTGNDFCNDLKDKVENGMIQVNEYIKNLPTVYINDKNFRFINGIGYGVDGMCCQVADDLRAKSDKPINYAAIAIKQCLYAFKKRDAEVTVDGVTKTYKNVWICPTMKGRFYGGGMMVAPGQDRTNNDQTVTLVVAHTFSRIRMLLTFTKVFTGEHVKCPIVDVVEGKEIEVKFTKPCAIQVDGETTRNVSSYKVKA